MSGERRTLQRMRNRLMLMMFEAWDGYSHGMYVQRKRLEHYVNLISDRNLKSRWNAWEDFLRYEKSKRQFIQANRRKNLRRWLARNFIQWAEVTFSDLAKSARRMMQVKKKLQQIRWYAVMLEEKRENMLRAMQVAIPAPGCLDHSAGAIVEGSEAEARAAAEACGDIGETHRGGADAWETPRSTAPAIVPFLAGAFRVDDEAVYHKVLKTRKFKAQKMNDVESCTRHFSLAMAHVLHAVQESMNDRELLKKGALIHRPPVSRTVDVTEVFNLVRVLESEAPETKPWAETTMLGPTVDSLVIRDARETKEEHQKSLATAAREAAELVALELRQLQWDANHFGQGRLEIEQKLRQEHVKAWEQREREFATMYGRLLKHAQDCALSLRRKTKQQQMDGGMGLTVMERLPSAHASGAQTHRPQTSRVRQSLESSYCPGPPEGLNDQFWTEYPPERSNFILTCSNRHLESPTSALSRSTWAPAVGTNPKPGGAKSAPERGGGGKDDLEGRTILQPGIAPASSPSISPARAEAPVASGPAHVAAPTEPPRSTQLTPFQQHLLTLPAARIPKLSAARPEVPEMRDDVPSQAPSGVLDAGSGGRMAATDAEEYPPPEKKAVMRISVPTEFTVSAKYSNDLEVFEASRVAAALLS
eukprot:gene1612-2250_t